MYLLKIKTRDGHSFKVLSELIQKYIKDGCWVIDKSGMTLTGVDNKTSKGTKLINVKLDRNNFINFKCPDEPLKIGMNMVHFYRMLKSIKKKDNTLTLFIEKDDPLKLYISISQTGEDKNKGIVGHINITLVRPISREEPSGYNDPIIITSKEFQKVKQLSKISKIMDISYSGKTIDFYCNKEGVYSKRVPLGDADLDELDEEEVKARENEDYKQTFDSDNILDLVKIANTSNNIQIFITQELPLHFKMYVGSLGTVDVYIKSRETVEEEDKEESETNENTEIQTE